MGHGGHGDQEPHMKEETAKRECVAVASVNDIAVFGKTMARTEVSVFKKQQEGPLGQRKTPPPTNSLL